MWDIIRELVTEGATLLLTTQYLEEADRLADKIAVIDVGQVIAEGTSDELKARVGGEVLALRVADREPRAGSGGRGAGARTRRRQRGQQHRRDQRAGRHGGDRDPDRGGPAPGCQGIRLADVGLRRPTLDDVFLALTGHAAEEGRRGAAVRGRRPVQEAASASEEKART